MHSSLYIPIIARKLSVCNLGVDIKMVSVCAFDPTTSQRWQLAVDRCVPCRFERLKETAFEYAFLLKTAGMLDVKPTPGSGSTAPAAGAAAATV